MSPPPHARRRDSSSAAPAPSTSPPGGAPTTATTGSSRFSLYAPGTTPPSSGAGAVRSSGSSIYSLSPSSRRHLTPLTNPAPSTSTTSLSPSHARSSASGNSTAAGRLRKVASNASIRLDVSSRATTAAGPSTSEAAAPSPPQAGQVSSSPTASAPKPVPASTTAPAPAPPSGGDPTTMTSTPGTSAGVDQPSTPAPRPGPSSDMKRKASLNPDLAPNPSSSRRKTWFGFGSALSAEPGADAPPPMDADEAAFRLALATGAASVQPKPPQSQESSAPMEASHAPQADGQATGGAPSPAEPAPEQTSTEADKPTDQSLQLPTNPRTTNSRGWFTWRAQVQTPAQAASSSSSDLQPQEATSTGPSAQSPPDATTRTHEPRRPASSSFLSAPASGPGAAKASQPLYASPLRRMWNRSEASPIEEQPESQSEAASLRGADDTTAHPTPNTLQAATNPARHVLQSSADADAANTSTWRSLLWPVRPVSTSKHAAYNSSAATHHESKVDLLSSAATSDIPSIMLNNKEAHGRGATDSDSRASTSQPSSSAGPGGYASYIAGWIPGWGSVNASPAASQVGSGGASTDGDAPGAGDATFVPRTPAEQVKAEALARPDRTPGAIAPSLSTVTEGVQKLTNPTEAILNSSTRKSWVSFFASRGAQPVRKLAVEGPEVMDLDEDASAPPSGSASLRAPPGGGGAGVARSASPSIAESAPAALRGGSAPTGKAPAAGKQASAVTSAASSVVGKEKGKSSGRSPPASAPTSPTVGPTSKDKSGVKPGAAPPPSAASEGKGKVANAANAIKTKISNASLGGRAKASSPAGEGPASPTKTGSAVEVKDPNAKVSKKGSLPPPKTPNLVLPSFEDTFSTPPRVWPPKVSVLERTIQAFNTYLFSKPPDLQRLGGTSTGAAAAATAGTARRRSSGAASSFPEEVTQRLPRSWEVMGDKARMTARGTTSVRKIVVLGIHGWFAQFAILKNVMGEPTGTSFKFATEMSEAIHRHFKEAGLELNPEAITVIALEGDGKVADRVHRLSVSLLSNPAWVRDLHEADAIFFSAHSQGTIVGTELLARLIEQKHIQPERTRVCLLAMAGIHEGPLPHLQSAIISSYLTYFETAAAKELFEFQNSTTPCSESYAAALRIILNAGVKAVYVASVDDQVVPLHGALHSAVMHPSILRALYIDGTAFPRADFLTNLLVLCTQVRNAGLNDHEVLSLLSTAVAGSLYSGLGHSNVYEEPAVYDLAVRYLFETTHPCGEPTCTGDHKVSMPSVNRNAFQVQVSNPFSLPWAIRGLLEDPDVRELFSEHMSDLLEQFAQWRPTNKAQKDVQLRLSPLKGLQVNNLRQRTTSSAGSSKPTSPHAPSTSKL